MDKHLAQMRLSNGSEIVAEIIEWPGEGENQIICRNCMCIIGYEYDDGQRGFAFKPWVNFLDDETDMILINSDHVIAMNKPTEYLIQQWNVSVVEMLSQWQERNSAFELEKAKGLERLAKALSEITGRDLDEIADELEVPDNVIPFPKPDDTVH